MDSGSVFDGYWGYVKNGIWKISENLTEINKSLGVNFCLSSNIENIDNAASEIDKYIQTGSFASDLSAGLKKVQGALSNE